MADYLTSKNFPNKTTADQEMLEAALQKILQEDQGSGDRLALLAGYQKILSDNSQRGQWDTLHEKLSVLFRCGQAVVVDGPMIGVSVSIRDSDLLQPAAQALGHDSSPLANLGLLGSLWNMTFAASGLWMGKTFEEVSRGVVATISSGNPDIMARYDQGEMRIGRNFFREVAHPNALTSFGLPALTTYWRLQDRPHLANPQIFNTQLTAANAQKERVIPYEKTGGIFLADMGHSVVPAMNGKAVYQLNYRWRTLRPAFPMSLLIDELVQIDQGVYLGQLVMATRHPQFTPSGHMTNLVKHALGLPEEPIDYGYQNNGFFLMIDTSLAKRAYAEDAFPQFRPRPGEAGYRELGYDQQPDQPHFGTIAGGQVTTDPFDWVSGWRENARLAEKFTTLTLENSPRPEDDLAVVQQELSWGESVLQMVKRLSEEVAAASGPDDKIQRFEKLNRLFRCGIAPKVRDGLFAPQGGGYNTRLNGSQSRDWYGQPDPLVGYDYYHGATLDLHWGFADNPPPSLAHLSLFDSEMLPETLLSKLSLREVPSPNLLDGIWKNIGKYIFPWAGKSFEKISGRKLSQLLDESADLAKRYPQRVAQLKNHPASLPHYSLVQKAAADFWPQPGRFASHLSQGCWDHGMSQADKAFWQEEANQRWVFGTNLQDERILPADLFLRGLDMNYGPPDPLAEEASRASGSPFVRQGYIFLGVADQPSILPMNNGPHPKQVFQFHYRYPMIGGAFPIGLCLDELVEIAQGLFLGQLIYATAIAEPFHSSSPTAVYKYQLFGYFMLMDDDWEKHRQAIGLDVWRP